MQIRLKIVQIVKNTKKVKSPSKIFALKPFL